MGWGKIKGEKKGLTKRGGEEKGRGAKALGGFTRGDGDVLVSQACGSCGAPGDTGNFGCRGRPTYRRSCIIQSVIIRVCIFVDSFLS